MCFDRYEDDDMASYSVNLPKDQLNRAKLRLLNCFFKLTDKELDIICTILDDEQKVITRSYRRNLMVRFKTTNYNLNNYIQRLKNKKILVASEDDLKVNDSLMNIINGNSLTFNFNAT